MTATTELMAEWYRKVGVYSLAPDIREIADKIISMKDELYHIREQDIRVGYMYTDKDSSYSNRKEYATCTKTSGLLKHFSRYDFIITFNEDTLIDLTEAQKEILVYHELLHIGEDNKLVKHNVNDFYKILSEFGLDWIVDDSVAGILGGEQNGEQHKA